MSILTALKNLIAKTGKTTKSKSIAGAINDFAKDYDTFNVPFVVYHTNKITHNEFATYDYIVDQIHHNQSHCSILMGLFRNGEEEDTADEYRAMYLDLVDPVMVQYKTHDNIKIQIVSNGEYQIVFPE